MAASMEVSTVRYVRALAALMVVAILVSVSLMLWSLRNRELHRAQLQAVSLTRMLMDQTEKRLESTDLVLQGIQERLRTPFGSQLELGSDAVRLLLHARVSAPGYVRAIYVVDAQGLLMNASSAQAMIGTSVADRDFFSTFAQGRADTLFLERPRRSALDAHWTLSLSRMLTGTDGRFRGVVVAELGVQALEQAFGATQLDYARPMGVYLLDGTLVASAPHRDGEIGMPAPELQGVTVPEHAGPIRLLARTTEAGSPEVLVLGQLPEVPLLIGVHDVASQSLASWRETALPIASGAALFCGLTLLFMAYLVKKLRHRQQLSLALSAADERYQHTVNSVMDAIVAVDGSMRITMFNPSAEAMFGIPAAQALGQSLGILIPPRLREVHGAHIQRFSAGAALSRAMAPRADLFGLRADGTEFPLESTISHALIGGRMQMTAVLRDVTQRRQAESELRMLNGQLRELSASLQQVREEERKRISRELHDDLGQQLTGLKLNLSWLGNRIREGRDTAAQNIDEMRHQLDAAIASVRRIAAEMRPRVLDDLDFSEALSWQAQEFSRHSQIPVALDLSAASLVRDEKVSTALFRIVQEALTNVARHAAARQVRISLTQQEQWLVLRIQDDGMGFDASLRQSGVGLVGMRERCTSIAGTFSIESKAGLGTTFVVRVPMEFLEARETSHET